MNIGSFLIVVALLLLVGLILARPFLVTEPHHSKRKQPFSRRKNLLAQKEALIAQVEALDFDHATGKVPAELYEPERTRLMQTAADVLRKIDETTSRVDQEIEATVAALRRQPSARSAPTNGALTGRARFCPQCGGSIEPDDKFCANCGHKI